MKNVLLIAPYFPPRRRVASLRPFKFAIRLKKFGWNPTVLTIQSTKGLLSNNEQDLLNGVKIVEIAPPFDRTTSTAKEPSATQKGPNRVSGFISEQIDKHTPLDTWILLFLLRYSSIKKDVAKYKPDLIWSTGDPWSGHWLGHKLSNELKIPWIADFRDPWTLSEVNLRPRSLFSHWVDRKAERKYVKSADHLIFTSRQTEQLYKEHYHLQDDKTSTIYNAYDPLLNQKSIDWDVVLDDDYFHVLFFGQFRKLSPVEPIAKAVSLMSPEKMNRLKIHSFGSMINKDAELIDMLNVEDQFVIHNPVLPSQTMNVLEKADLLLVSTDQRRKHIIPAKLWDYLATDRPILSIAPNPEVGTILESTGQGKQINPDHPKKIALFLEEQISEKEAGSSKKSNRKSYSNKFTIEAATSTLAQRMDQVLTVG
jgi:glycosyltransferase involved in cell wall biosynthesis